MKKKMFLVLTILLGIVLVSGVSYAFFTVIISGNDTAKENVVVTGDMELTYTDGEEISLNNAFPGDSVSKTFTVKNTGTLTTTYNIKMVDVVNTFVDKSDLIYTLTGDNGVSVVDKVVPSSTGYLFGKISIDSGITHTYTLTITFKKTTDDQNDNQGVIFSGKVNIDGDDVFILDTPTNLITHLNEEGNKDVAIDDYDNIRYIGADPANYIYFNCDDFNNPTAETCEKWRMIGAFKNIKNSAGQSVDLVKIINPNYLTADMPWDENNGTNWDSATLNTYLNNDYYNSLKNDTTKDLIESVYWNIGVVFDDGAPGLYSTENELQTANASKIALANPSDFAYAFGGGSTSNRDECLYILINSLVDEECSNSNYLYNSDKYEWTINLTSLKDSAYIIHNQQIQMTYNNQVNFSVRPVLYLTSSVKILSGDGTSESPYVLYQELPTVVDKVNELYASNNPELVVDDYENIRYIGANPSNYIYFNCDDYNNPSAETCEKWRIIGSFKDIEDNEGQVADRVKIMRDESIGNMAWDPNYYNNWATATLNTYLNGEYYNSLKNDTTKNLIDSVVWNLGGTSRYTSASNGLIKHWYQYERAAAVYGSNPKIWTGKLALMYPSDYGYATSGGSTTNREACLNKELYSWDSVSDCKSNNYIFDSSTDQWTLTHYSATFHYAFYVTSFGHVDFDSAFSGYGVRPVLYLGSNAVIVSGDGSEASPYVLGA